MNFAHSYVDGCLFGTEGFELVEDFQAFWQSVQRH